MGRDNPCLETAESPVSVEERRNVARSVASRSPCDAQERTSVVVPAIEVVPPPSVCSTAVGPPRRTSLLLVVFLLQREHLLRRTMNTGRITQTGEVRTDLYQSLQFFYLSES